MGADRTRATRSNVSPAHRAGSETGPLIPLRLTIADPLPALNSPVSRSAQESTAPAPAAAWSETHQRPERDLPLRAMIRASAGLRNGVPTAMFTPRSARSTARMSGATAWDVTAGCGVVVGLRARDAVFVVSGAETKGILPRQESRSDNPVRLPRPVGQDCPTYRRIFFAGVILGVSGPNCRAIGSWENNVLSVHPGGMYVFRVFWPVFFVGSAVRTELFPDGPHSGPYENRPTRRETRTRRDEQKPGLLPRQESRSDNPVRLPRPVGQDCPTYRRIFFAGVIMALIPPG